MSRHGQYVPYIFPSVANWANDPEYLTDILPDVFASFNSDSGLLDNSNFFEIIAIHALPPSQTATVPQPTDNQHKDRGGELRISLDTLLSVSDQWFFEVKKFIAPEPAKHNWGNAQFHTKVNFPILDQNGTVLTSSMQARLSETHWTQNINTQVVGETYFHTLDITHLRAKYSTCKFLAIRMYAHSKTIFTINNGGYQGYLKCYPSPYLGMWN